MQLITEGFMILALLGSCFGLPQPGSDYDDVTTAESIDNIFRKYDQQYPFHGGNNDDVQSDAPVIEAILERLNEIITDDRPNDFVAPNAESGKEQRSLLKKQNEELIFGPTRLNRRVKDAKHRSNDEDNGGGFFDFEQTGAFFNKDLLADNYNTQVADRLPATTTRRTLIAASRIPVSVSTRFPTRRTTTTAAPIVPNNPERETFIDLVEDEILEKPEGNKLSIPVLSVATEDFEEDIPQKPVTPMRPNKLTAQTEDFEDSSRNQFDNYRRQAPMFRRRRESGSGSMEWFVNRVASFLNFYDEPEIADEGRKMSVLSKRQIPGDLAIDPLAPIPEEVKSVDVPTQVSDAVIETIQDIADPQTRNEFTKDVPAIEDKLDEIGEKEEVAQPQTVEVTLVELGQTEAESLGSIEADPIADAFNESRQLIVGPEVNNATEINVQVPKSLNLFEIPIEAAEKKTPEVEMKVLRDQMPDDSSRSGIAQPAKIADIIAAIPSELVSVMAPTETIRDDPETARKIDPVAAVTNTVTPEDNEDDEKLSYIEVERLVPMIKGQKVTTAPGSETVPKVAVTREIVDVQAPVNEDILIEELPKPTVTAADPTITSAPAPAIPISHTTMLVEDKVVPEGDYEPALRKVTLEAEVVSGQSLSEIKSTIPVIIPITNETREIQVDGRSGIAAPTEENMIVEDRRPEFAVQSVDIPAEIEQEKVNPIPQIKTPIVEHEQDFEIVIEPEAEDEPSPKSLDAIPAGIAEVQPTTPVIAVPPKTEIVDHIVEETVLITENVAPSSADMELNTTATEDPTVPLISESVDTRLNSMIIAEVLEDENMDVGFNAGGEPQTTVLPLDWLKDDLSRKEESRKSFAESGSNSHSISTTESISEWEMKTTPFGSSEEIDSKEDEWKIAEKQEKKRFEEEAKRLKDERKRLWKEEKAQKKALLGDKSSEEEDHDEKKASSNRVELITKFVEPEAKFTKEEMVNLFSSPEMDIDPRTLAATAEVNPSAPKNVSHVVIKKDRVEIDEEDDDSEESGEATTAALPNDLMDQLAAELEQEKATVEKALDALQNAIDETRKEDVETNLVDTGSNLEQPQEMNTVITSKNTRHLAKVGYSEDDYVQKDIEMDGREAKLNHERADNEEHSRAFLLLGSALFLIIGFVLFALVVIIKRTRTGSMDLNFQA